MANDTPKIFLKNVEKRYAGTAALQQTSLAVSRAETTALIGPSGCGKSTLLRLMIGLIEPSRGEVWFEGTLLAPDNLGAIRRKMGYVIQEGGLFPHLTAAENVVLMATHINLPAEKIESQLAVLSALTHFPTEALNRYPVELSGGQRQRVGLMRALFLDPDVLLLDEPLGALGPMVRAALQEELKEIFKQLGKTVVLVTHDMAEAAYLADTIVLLKEGRILQKGGIDALLDHPADPFVTEFINAQRSLVRGRTR